MGRLYTVRNELQNTCDAATLAVARALVVETTVTGTAGTAPGTYLDAAAAKDAAMIIINNAAYQQGLACWGLSYGDAAVSITFGHWEDKTSTWTAIGDYSAVPTNPSPSDPNVVNAVEVKIHRGSTGTYGPVSNFFGGVFGLSGSTSQVAATSRAYLGYAMEVPLGTVPIPLALPPDVLNPSAPDNQNVSNGRAGWFASLFSPDKAVAATVKQFYFKDIGRQQC